MNRYTLCAEILGLLLLVGCSRAIPPASQSPLPPPATSSSQGEEPPEERPPELEASRPEEPCAVPYRLSELGYYFDSTVDTGHRDPNQPMEMDKFPIYPKEPPYYFTTEQATAIFYGLFYTVGFHGTGNLWGEVMIVQPDCNYGVGSQDNGLAFALLQAFLREDIQAPQAYIEFLKEEKDQDGIAQYTHYALPAADLARYKVYEDEDIVVYNFLDFTNAPPYEEQLRMLAEDNRYDERGIQWRWLIEVGEYFYDAPGGIGSFIHKMDRPWLNQ